MNIPRPTAEDKKLFAELVPIDSRVKTRPMFGNDAAFVNGNLFFGIYGPDVFVRLPPDLAEELLREEGSRQFEPAPGRKMGGYVVVPRAWKTKKSSLREWTAKSLEWASSLPVKKPKR